MFKSFFFAGFEGTTGYNKHGQWIDQVAATRHDLWADEDYRMLSEAGIRAARESVRWPIVDHNGSYDFSCLAPFLSAADRHGIQIIFDLFHFGYPEGLDLFSPEFPVRFADYCGAAARYLSGHSGGPLYFTPVNEPSYFAWAAGEVGLFAPHVKGRGWELKVCLIRAAIAGIDAIRELCPGARFVNVDPLCRVTVPFDRPDLCGEADDFNRRIVFNSWDMLNGTLLPELGGSPSHLDIVGVNYYWTNQWDLSMPGIPLCDDDPRRVPLRDLIAALASRYDAEILITETAHVDDMRPVWLREVIREAEALIEQCVPLRGICLYPATAMPEWHAREEWVKMGLWDVALNDHLHRIRYEAVLEALREGQQRLEGMQYTGPG